MNPTFLSKRAVLRIHESQIGQQSQSGLRDEGLLDSALAVPQSSYGGQFLHGDLYEMAAAYAYHISENQPFIDGNKRTAVVAAIAFLRRNNIKLIADQMEFYKIMMAVAKHEISKSDLADFIRENCAALSINPSNVV